MHRLLPWAVLLATSMLPGTADAEGLSVPALPVEALLMPNGLRVLLAPDPAASLTSVLVSYDAGAGDDPDGLRGLAHLTEHLVAERTKHVERVLPTLASAGAFASNATTSAESTIYFETVPPERLETVLWVESDRMGYAMDVVSETRVIAARGVVHNEERDRRDTPLAIVGGLVHRELLPAWHPYAPAATSYDHIHEADVRAFLATWYAPSNATLAIAGRFARETAVDLVKKYFGSLRGPDIHPRPHLRPWTAPPTWLEVKADVPRDRVIVQWRTPARGTPDDVALQLAARALAGPGNQRFSRTLVGEHLATSVVAQQASDRDTSIFTVNVGCAAGVEPSAVLRIVQETIDAFAKGLEADEVVRARETLELSMAERLETTTGRVSALVEMSRLGMPMTPASRWGLARYASVTERDVALSAGSFLTRDHRMAITVYADHASPVSGKLLSRQEL